MNIPGFTAELSLTRKGNYYERLAAHNMASPGIIQPAALVNIPRIVCWCAEEGMIEIDDGPFRWLVEACLRFECVMIPIFYDL